MGGTPSYRCAIGHACKAAAPRRILAVALAKFLLITAILLAILLGLFMRVRAWLRQRAARRAAHDAEIERMLRE